MKNKIKENDLPKLYKDLEEETVVDFSNIENAFFFPIDSEEMNIEDSNGVQLLLENKNTLSNKLSYGVVFRPGFSVRLSLAFVSNPISIDLKKFAKLAPSHENGGLKTWIQDLECYIIKTKDLLV